MKGEWQQDFELSTLLIFNCILIQLLNPFFTLSQAPRPNPTLSSAVQRSMIVGELHTRQGQYKGMFTN